MTKIFLQSLVFLLLSTFMANGFAKEKYKFDVKAFRENVKNNEYVYESHTGHQIREMETPILFIQKEYAGNYVYLREFNKDGKILRTGTYAKVAKQEIPVGEWTSFDTKGKVSEIKNHEEGFQVTYGDVLEICEKRNINLTDRLSSLTKSKPGERPMWVIGWNSLPPRSDKVSQNDRSPTTKMEVIVVDGVTGEIKESTPYVPFQVKH